MTKGNFLVLILLVEVIFFVVFRYLDPALPLSANGKAVSHELSLGQHLILMVGGLLGIIFVVLFARTMIKVWKRMKD